MSPQEVPLGPIAATLAFGIAMFVLGRMVFRSRPRFEATPLLSEWEQRVLADLRESAPDNWHICPQVRIADFISTKGGMRKTRFAVDAQIRQRSVDFLLIDDAAAPRLVIELDDRTHSRRDRRRHDKQNDAAYQEAGVAVRHVRPGHKPDWSAVLAELTAGDTKACHGGPMAVLVTLPAVRDRSNAACLGKALRAGRSSASTPTAHRRRRTRRSSRQGVK